MKSEIQSANSPLMKRTFGTSDERAATLVGVNEEKCTAFVVQTLSQQQRQCFLRSIVLVVAIVRRGHRQLAKLLRLSFALLHNASSNHCVLHHNELQLVEQRRERDAAHSDNAARQERLYECDALVERQARAEAARASKVVDLRKRRCFLHLHLQIADHANAAHKLFATDGARKRHIALAKLWLRHQRCSYFVARLHNSFEKRLSRQVERSCHHFGLAVREVSLNQLFTTNATLSRHRLVVLVFLCS